MNKCKWLVVGYCRKVILLKYIYFSNFRLQEGTISCNEKGDKGECIPTHET